VSIHSRGAQPQRLARPSASTFVSARPRRRRTRCSVAWARAILSCASIRRGGRAAIKRLNRDGSRGGQPNKSIEIAEPRRAWRGERSTPRRERAGAQATVDSPRAFEWKPALSAATSFNSVYAR